MSSAVPMYRTEKRTTMKKCLLLLAVLSVAFVLGSAIRCYRCSENDCRDPYIANSTHIRTCPLWMEYCGKAVFDTGDVTRDCIERSNFIPSIQHNESKALQDRLAGRQAREFTLNFCKDGDLCNGSGRQAVISTTMILFPASIVLLISFFSKL